MAHGVSRVARLMRCGGFWLSATVVALTSVPVVADAGNAGAPAAERGTALVIFVDFSGSIQSGQRASFRREIEGQIMPSLGPGDRVVVAPIHDKTLTAFRPFAEVILPVKPVFSGWANNVIKFNQQAQASDAQFRALKEAFRVEVAEGLARAPASPHTDIFSSLIVTEKLFADERRRKVLLLMSDMIEDTPTYNFEKIRWGTDTTPRLLAELEAKRMVADLSGVCVYVSGASARTAELAQHIGRFWEAYFKQARADLDTSRYARVLLHWPPPKSCRTP
jgi:hypothetical protein